MGIHCFWALFLALALAFAIIGKAQDTTLVPSIVTFGDSAVDVGNNEYLPTIFKSNYPPYGRDFINHQPTGRFCNGKLATDITDLPPSIPYHQGIRGNLLIGANFASAGSIYDDKTAILSATLPGKQEPLIQQFGREYTHFIFESQIITKSGFIIQLDWISTRIFCRLTILNLTGNNLTGSVPQAVINKFEEGTLSLGENPNLCLSVSCQGKKKKKFLVPLLIAIPTVIVILILITALAIIRKLIKRRGTKETVTECPKEGPLKSGNSEFTFSDVARREVADVLNWKQRLQIAVDAAQGLEYLHIGCKPPIVHRDMKSSKILLTETQQAKIADFGMSRDLATESGAFISTVPAGTPEYLDPDIVGPRLQGDFNTISAWKALEITLACVASTGMQRPDMSHVLADLKECLGIEVASRRIQSVDSLSFGSGNFLEDSPLILGTQSAPHAR
ncbi:putative LRR receptor-like serine/threonine-protein kinase [Vitis vinifera]|uniref:Putative LRR receptor-like serine/threonine-protein kinase n=1 Tax=Vitis vinifera TaxID=29760 RepID=A0A438EW63_VITVI|nr:putative LRR receptor-like serine/threonine-protein kinase [Vitis vinifera]